MIIAEYTEYVPPAKDKAAFDAIETLFNELDELLSEQLGDKYQGMGPIRSLLRDKGRMIPAEAPKAAPAPATPAGRALPN